MPGEDKALTLSGETWTVFVSGDQWAAQAVVSSIPMATGELLKSSFAKLSNCDVGDSKEFGAILQWQKDVQACLYCLCLLILYILLRYTPSSIFDIDGIMQDPWKVQPSSAQAVYLLKVSKPFVQQTAEFCADYLLYHVRHSKRTCCWLPTQWSDN